MAVKDEPLYRLWISMHSRCRDPKSTSYRYYGARGIVVCDRWSSFAAFKEDMGERPEGTSLDRRNTDEGYSPENCRWATYAEQNGNKRDTILVEINGITKPMSVWARERGISPQAAHYRIRKLGLTPVDALSMPASRKTRNHPRWIK